MWEHKCPNQLDRTLNQYEVSVMSDWAHVWIEQVIAWRIATRSTSTYSSTVGGGKCKEEEEEEFTASIDDWPFAMFSAYLYMAFRSFVDIADTSKYM